MTPALDIIKSRLADAAHSEYAGMARRCQTLLIEAILTPASAKMYAAELRRFPFPLGWGRLQSPIHHLKSWRMQEAGRTAIITPMLLRCWIRDGHIRDLFLRAVKYVFGLGSRKEALEQIIRFYAKMAKSTSVILSTNVSPENWGSMNDIILEGR